MTSKPVGYKAKAFEPRNLICFFLIAFGWSWFWWALFIFGVLKMPAGIGTPDVDLASASPFIILIALTPYGPTIAGFVITALTEGKTGVKSLWRRFWNRNISVKWLLICLLFFPALQLTANLVSRALDSQSYPILAWSNQPWMFIPPFIANTLINGGMSEEFGWRGYVLPRFQSRWNALTSSIVLGIIWASWHIPLWFVPGDNHTKVFFWRWAMGLILFSILMTWIFNNADGSVLMVILFHGMGNAVGDLIWCCGTSAWHYYSVELLMVILIVISFGPKNLVRLQSAPRRLSIQAKRI